ncbi:MAG: hypothetical protein JNM22_00860 [Saprospiraceae bacterium]|nr:hypothetical protein [Saprospiraceae bacterium]
MNNKTLRLLLNIAIIGTLIYLLAGIPDMIVHRMFVGEETAGYMRGISLSKGWMIAAGSLTFLLILRKFIKPS